MEFVRRGALNVLVADDLSRGVVVGYFPGDVEAGGGFEGDGFDGEEGEGELVLGVSKGGVHEGLVWD